MKVFRIGLSVVTALTSAAASSGAQGAGTPWRVTARGDSLQLDSLTVTMRGGERVAERGTLRVPELRGGNGNRRITLRWLRFASTTPGARTPIVFLAGGPGDAGTRAISTMPLPMLDSLRQVGDMIAFDQRATGQSVPLLACAPMPGVPPELALSRAQRDSIAQDAARRCLEQLDAAGAQRAGYSTRESAEDLESLRVALGVPSISLMGGSYGTHLGLAYMRAYPTRVTRAVLAGVEGPDDTFKLPGNVDAVFADIARRAASDPQFAGRTPLLATFDSLRTRLDATTPLVTVATTAVRMDGFDLQRFVADALGDQRTIAALPAQLYAMADGNLDALGRAALRLRAPRALNAMNLLMNCASGATPARWARIDAERATSRLGDAIDYPANVQCRMPALRAPGASPAELTTPVPVPVMFMTGTWDGRTPVANVEALLPRHPAGRHLVVEYQSHGLMGDPIVVQYTLRFLRGEDLPGVRILRSVPAFTK